MNKFVSLMDSRPILLAIQCLAYNQIHYIRQCLDGFVMQKTDFRFIAIVHDDASTDGTAEVVREYAEKYPDIIVPIIESENQYSKGAGFLRDIMSEATEKSRCRYVAICEGDDYWIDPLKLQKQVDFLEAHPDYSMVCSDAVIMSPKGELDFSRFRENTTIPFRNLIKGGGGYVMTATLLYRRELMAAYPEFCLRCHVGDYPLQLYMGVKGNVYYFAEKMAAYRFNINGSWTARQSSKPIEAKIKGWRSEVDMLNGMDELSNRVYTRAFQKCIAKYMYWNIYNHHESVRQILDAFKDVKISFRMGQCKDILLIRAGLFNVLHKYKTAKRRIKRSR